MSYEYRECPKCGSSDALTVYDDRPEWGHCFSCGENIKLGESVTTNTPFHEIQAKDLPKRGIKASVMRSHGYGCTSSGLQAANYVDKDGTLVAQKLKSKDKKFAILGDAKKMTLWQQHRWKPGGRRLVITEGETDLLSWQSLMGDRYPAVSLPNGASAAVKDIKKAIDFVESFDQVILMFDADEPGRKAANDVAALLTPGKCMIAQVPSGAKDVCDAVGQGLGEALVKAFWEAKPQRPDGIVSSAELLEAVLAAPAVTAIDYPWKGLNDKLLGIRPRELVTVTAGTGVGKSQLCRALAWHLIKSGQRVGYISLEEGLARTGLGLLSQVMGKKLHIEPGDEAEMTAAFNEHLEGRVCVFNHFGSMDAENLLSRCRYMRIAEGCEFLIVDHLSILVSGWGDGDERRLIDNVMTSLRSIVEQTGVGMFLVSHLKRPSEGKGHEEGRRPRLSDLRGSQSIPQLSDAVIAASRDQQGDSPDVTTIDVLKNRFAGFTGPACKLTYNHETTRFTEGEYAEEQDYGF